MDGEKLLAEFRDCVDFIEKHGNSDRPKERFIAQDAARRARVLAPEVSKLAAKRIAALEAEMRDLKRDLHKAANRWANGVAG